jgi:hypothetical protein
MVGFAQDVRFNFAVDQNFAKFRTYKWVQIQRADKLDPLLDQQLRTIVELELTKRHLTRTEGEKADLFLAYQASIGQERQFMSFNEWENGPGWSSKWFGGKGTRLKPGQRTTIQIGELDLDMYDVANKRLVWRAIASKTIDLDATPEEQQRNLKKVIIKLLSRYPPHEAAILEG